MASREPLTPTQEKYLVWIENYMRLEGMAPTFRELANGLRVNILAAVEATRILERKGWLRRKNVRRVSRNFFLTYRGTYSRLKSDAGPRLPGTCSGNPSGQCQGSHASSMCAPPEKTVARTV